jgi:hypothetical protein
MNQSLSLLSSSDISQQDPNLLCSQRPEGASPFRGEFVSKIEEHVEILGIVLDDVRNIQVSIVVS